jgi:hypothetical protein
MVGLPCSGKTTLARRMEVELRALRLTPDEWHLQLFGEDTLEPDHDRRHSLVESLMWQVAERSLHLGVDVILDFGFWARSERQDFRARARRLGVGFEVHYADCSLDELLRRLAQRNAAGTPGCFVIPEDRLRAWAGKFEPPDAEELAG